MVMERKPAAPEAVANRRANRRARRESDRLKAQRRDTHDREVAVRMMRRFFPPVLYPEGPPLIALDYRYWQARRCGWDVMDKSMRLDASGRSCTPMECAAWLWWTRDVHPKQRGQLVAMSGIRLLRRA